MLRRRLRPRFIMPQRLPIRRQVTYGLVAITILPAHAGPGAQVTGLAHRMRARSGWRLAPMVADIMAVTGGGNNAIAQKRVRDVEVMKNC